MMFNSADEWTITLPKTRSDDGAYSVMNYVSASRSEFVSILREFPEISYRREIEVALFGPFWDGVLPELAAEKSNTSSGADSTSQQ